METNKQFIEIISKLNTLNLLEKLIIVGGWCLEIYRYHFKDDLGIPRLRTLDIDILVPRKFDCDKIQLARELELLGFSEEFSLLNNKAKYCRPDIEVEFLYPLVGKEFQTSRHIDKLGITVEPLRFMDIAEKYCVAIDYFDYSVKVPHPAAFVLHKLLVVSRRKSEEKKAKDYLVALELGEFVLNNPILFKEMISIINEIPAKWKKTILNNINDKSLKLKNALSKSN